VWLTPRASRTPSLMDHHPLLLPWMQLPRPHKNPMNQEYFTLKMIRNIRFVNKALLPIVIVVHENWKCPCISSYSGFE